MRKECFVLNESAKLLRRYMNEAFGISMDIHQLNSEFCDYYVRMYNEIPWGTVENPNVKYINFAYKFFDKIYGIKSVVYNYSSDDECIRYKRQGNFNSCLIQETNTLVFNFGACRGLLYPPTFDDIVKHELQHIYKILKGGDIKPSSKILRSNKVYTEELYNKVCDIMNDNEYSLDIRNIAYAIYSSFEFERNGFIGGLDGIFDNFEYLDDKGRHDYSMMHRVGIDRKNAFEHSACFDAYNNIVEVINVIDSVDSDLIYKVFGIYKYKIKKLLEISRNDYIVSIGKIICSHSVVLNDGDNEIIKLIKENSLCKLPSYWWLL